MSNLTEMAKENGAEVSFNGYRVAMTDDQLQATVEKVCKPLLIALETADIWIDTLPVPTSSATRMGILVTQALTEYRKSIGQDK